MNLQSILQFYFALPNFGINTAASATCRCLYDQPCWPNEIEFAGLATQLSQPLLHPLPTASLCYPPSVPSANCQTVIENYTNSTWRSDQPGSMQFINFETFIFDNGAISACYLNTTLEIPCRQGSVPPIGVDARSGSDVQAAVNFARQHNLKLVVKNTGHDYLGRSTARGSFLIWTHNMKEISYNPTFIPEGAPVTAENTFDGNFPFCMNLQCLIMSYLLMLYYLSAVTLGAGVQWGEAYDFARKQGRFVVGGTSASVGSSGGWVMGGGHSAYSPKFGLGTLTAILILFYSACFCL